MYKSHAQCHSRIGHNVVKRRLINKAKAFMAVLVTAICTTSFAYEKSAVLGYSVDHANSYLEFSFMQAGAENRGVFANFFANLKFAPDHYSPSSIEVDVEVNSLDTQDEARDDILRGPDFFDVTKFPHARFTSSRIIKTTNGFSAVGELTIRGVTHDAHIPFTLHTTEGEGESSVDYLMGNMIINRLDFGVGRGDWESDTWVGNDVIISYNLKLIANETDLPVTVIHE